MRRFAAPLRRTFAGSLALMFALQSAGSALATTPQRNSLQITPLSARITSALQSLRATQLGAILSGDGSRWAAMHALPPVFKHEAPPQPAPPDRHVNDSRQFRTGIFRTGPHMLSQPLNANEAPQDPRAMAHSAANPFRRQCMQGKTPCVTQFVRIRGGIQTMSITPTVQPFLFEADTTSGPTTPIFVTAGIESGAVSRTMDSAPANSSSNQMLTYTPYSGSVSFGWVSPANVPNSIAWPAQTYTVALNITQANPNIKIIEVTILRVDSSGGGGSGTDGLAIVGTLTGLSQSLGTTGTLTFNVSGAAQSASATDRIAVKIVVQNTATTSQSFSYLAGQNSGSGLNLGIAKTLGNGTTGINPWWTYEEGTLPGHGKYMVNVGNGNLLVQATDVDIPERGIDLAFRRTFNSQSTHDSNNTDASVPSNYGDGWTNTFDAHLAYHGANMISVFDIDGARYDYTADGSGTWTPPAGQHAVLKWDGACGYQWTKKTGTVYYFYSPDLNETATCTEFNPSAAYPQDSAYGGRLYKIWGRNSKNAITFGYKWYPDATNPSDLTEIDATHSDGHALVLKFGSAVSGGPTELLSVTRPDGQVINYYYASNGSNLQWAYLPGNSAYSALKESYGYNTGHQLHYATSPRYNATSGDGNVTYFNYDGSNRLTQSYDWGLVNFTPTGADNTGIALQSGSTSLQTWRTVNYSGYGSGTTSMTDSDGHATNWSVPNDSTFRVTQTQEATGASPTYLVTTQKWDANNNLLETTDARGNATDYAYDVNGNTIAVALPSVTIGGATFRPTSLYSYDIYQNVNYNNVTSYCDPVSNHSSSPNRDWNPGTSPTPAPAACPTAAPATVYKWDHTSDPTLEPFGRLGDAYTPLGYHTHITYDSTKQANVDAGLPTTVQAANAIGQNDGTSRTPTQSFTYDGYGNVLTYSKGVGSWSLSYDTMNNRLITATDPTGATSYKYYNNDGSLSKTETAYQHVTNTGTTFQYDADGYVTQQGVSHGGAYVIPTPGANPTPTPNVSAPFTTTKFYDGADRLVEVVQPQDTADIYTKPWITRYVYDLSSNGTSTTYSRQMYQGQTLVGYGNLVKTQEFLPSGQTLTTRISSMVPSQFDDLKGQSFDALDRVVAKLQMANTGGTSDVVNKDTMAYDSSGYYGLMTSSCNALGQCVNPAYDNLDETIQTTFSDSTPAETYSFDADGRTASVSNTYATVAFQYDADGRKVQSVETLGKVGTTALTSPATLTYHYYADGKRSSVDVTSLAMNQSSLFSYAYRTDGSLSWQQINDGSIPGFANSGTLALAMTYDNAGRLLTRNETGAGANPTPISITYNSYGLATQKAYPGGTLGAIEYDASGAPLGYEPTWPGQTSYPVVQYIYTARGELRGDTTADTYAEFANSAVIMQSYPSKTPQLYQTVDPVMGIVLSHSNVPPGTDPASVSTYSALSEQYNNAGQATTVSTTDATTNSLGTYCETDTSANRQFDALNHVTNESYSYDNSSCSGPFTRGSASYAWGANGHPVAVGSGFATSGSTPPPISGWDTLHWDGDQLLFTTNPQGQVDDIKVGTIGDIIPSTGLVFYDRGFGANISYCHTGSSVSGVGAAYHNLAYNTAPCALAPNMLWAGSPPAPLTKQDTGGVPHGVGNGGLLASVNGDGWGDDYNTIQGLRSVDALTNQWSTPDAYSGEVHDPISQKSYVWEGDNPMSYSDPSGYYATISLLEASSGVLENFDNIDTAFSQAQSTGNASAPAISNSAVAQVVPLAEAVLEAGEAEGGSVTAESIEEGWSAGGKGIDKAYDDHGVEMGMSESAYAARPAQLIVNALKPGGAPAVIGAQGRLYVYDTARKAMAIFGTKGALTIENYYRASYQHFLNQGALIYSDQVREAIGGLLSH